MRIVLLVLLLAGCATTQQKRQPDPAVLERWGPHSLEWWEETTEVRLCNLEPDTCAEILLEATE